MLTHGVLSAHITPAFFYPIPASKQDVSVGLATVSEMVLAGVGFIEMREGIRNDRG
jgi:hypothetical protein